MATAQYLKIDETVTSSNDYSDPVISAKLPEEEKEERSTSEETTPKLINDGFSFDDICVALSEDIYMPNLQFYKTKGCEMIL